MQKLSHARMQELFAAVSLDGESAKTSPDLFLCIIHKFAFDKIKLEENRANIVELLNELSPEFHVNGGGGTSFLSMCQTKDGVLWGEHIDMEVLTAMGMALGLVSFALPRDAWAVLPGSMPYIIINTTQTVPEPIAEPV